MGLGKMGIGSRWNTSSAIWYLSDREGHGHKAVLYKSHFLPLRHSVVRETPLYT